MSVCTWLVGQTYYFFCKSIEWERDKFIEFIKIWVKYWSQKWFPWAEKKIVLRLYVWDPWYKYYFFHFSLVYNCIWKNTFSCTWKSHRNPLEEQKETECFFNAVNFVDIIVWYWFLIFLYCFLDIQYWRYHNFCLSTLVQFFFFLIPNNVLLNHHLCTRIMAAIWLNMRFMRCSGAFEWVYLYRLIPRLSIIVMFATSRRYVMGSKSCGFIGISGSQLNVPGTSFVSPHYLT